MLVIKNSQGNEEALTDIVKMETIEEVNGDINISFTCLHTEKNAHSYPLIQVESIVEFEGHEYRVKNVFEEKNQKTVIAQHIYFDLIRNFVATTNGGTKTVEEFLTIALQGVTGWTFENVNVTGTVTIPNFGKDNSISLIRTICSAFDCEVKVESKHLKIVKEIGEDNDVQFRYKHNIKSLNKLEDTSRLATIIKGYGANNLEVEYRSPNIELFGEIYAPPVIDERYSVPESLLERCKKEIVDSPEISFQIDLAELGSDVGLGDKVWTFYEPMSIELQQRIVAIRRFPLSRRSPLVTLSNRRRTLSEEMIRPEIEIGEVQKQTQSRFEQTDEKFSFEVERIDGEVTEAKAQIQINADSITSKVSTTVYETGIADAKTYAEIKAIEAKDGANFYTDSSLTPIVTRVTSAESSISQLANDITLKVNQDVYVQDKNGLNARLSSAESSLSIQAGQINSKVSQTDYNGNTIASLINQSATTITLDSSKIDLLGITSVSNELNIGTAFNDSTFKAIRFRGPLGGAHITSSNADWLNVHATNALTLSSYGYLYFDAPNIDFGNANITRLNVTAKFG